MHKDVLTTRIPSPIDIYSLALAVITLLEASKLPLGADFCWKILGDVEQILDRRAQATASAGEFEDLFSTPQWDQQLRAWIGTERSNQSQQQSNENTNAGDADQGQNPTHSSVNNGNTTHSNTSSSQPPLVGPNEQRSLQHLADLAVGAEGTSTNDDGSVLHTATTPVSGSAPAGTAAPSNAMDISNEAEGSGSATAAGNGTTHQGPAAATTTGLGGAATVDFSSALRRGFMNVLSMPPGSRH